MVIRRALIWVVAAVHLVVQAAQAQSVPAAVRHKVDAPLLDVAAQLARGERAQSRALASTGNPRDPFVRCLVKVASPEALRAMERLGGVLGSRHGDIVTVRLSARRIAELALRPDVLAIEGSYRLYPALDAALPDAHVDVVKTYPLPQDPATLCSGAGVIVGATDSGIDFRHADFRKDPGDTETRVIWLWDQGDTTPGRTPPSSRGFAAGWNYGGLYDNAQMDAGECPHRDDGAHGTHVMGIAAGDGSGTGNGQPSHTYVGCASAADIIMVKNSVAEFWDYMGYYAGSGETLDAYAFIRTAAGQVGKPHVINTSEGTDMGPHDGTTLLEQGINADAAAGSVICVAASNSGSDRKHIAGSVGIGSPLTISLNASWAAGAPLPIDCWYSGGDRLYVEVQDRNLTWHGPYDPQGGPYTFKCDGYTNSVSSTTEASINGDNRWLLSLGWGGTSAEYPVQIRFSAANALPDGGLVHCWIETGYSSYFPAAAVPGAYSLGMPACAKDAITVAAHATKLTWVDVTGTTQADVSETLGDVLSFSSRGPTRTQAYLKPEVSAPGMHIASSLSSYFPVPDSYKARDGVHWHIGGTSMATPMVAGTVALMLQRNAWVGRGTATPAMIKQALLDHCRADTFTGAVPNYTWGYGKLQADAAWNAVPTDAGVSDFRARVQGSQVRLTWSGTDDLDCIGFNVLRAATIAGPWVKANDQRIPRGSGRRFIFDDHLVGVPGGQYLYCLQTVGSGGEVRSRGSTIVDFGRPSEPQAKAARLQQLATGVSDR